MEEDFFVNETPASRINGLQAEINQMNHMITENYRMIDLGDDVEARKKMISILTSNIAEREAEIEKCKKNLQ